MLRLHSWKPTGDPRWSSSRTDHLNHYIKWLLIAAFFFSVVKRRLMLLAICCQIRWLFLQLPPGSAVLGAPLPPPPEALPDCTPSLASTAAFLGFQAPALAIQMAKDSAWRLLFILCAYLHIAWGPRTPSQHFPACVSDSPPSNPPPSVSLQSYAEAQAVAWAWNALTPLTNSLRFWCSDSF